MEKEFFYIQNGKKIGPVTKDQLRSSLNSRKTLIWFSGLSQWTSLREIPELIDICLQIPPTLPSDNFEDKIPSPPLETTNNKIRTSTNKRNKNNKYWIFGILITSLAFIGISIYKAKIERDFAKKLRNNSIESSVDFDFYVNKFYRDLEAFSVFPQRPETQIIKLSNLDQIADATHLHGISLGGNDDDLIEIYINKTSWEQFNRAQKYMLMYHELGHDILNLEDLDPIDIHKGKLMYPEISTYNNLTMDEFITAYKLQFELLPNF